MSSSEKPAEVRRSKPRKGLICASCGSRPTVRQPCQGKGVAASAYLGLCVVVLLALGELRADGAVQQPGHRAWRCRTRHRRYHRRVDAVFVYCGGALLALLERAEPRRQLRTVSEQAAGVYEAQAAALQLGARFADLRRHDSWNDVCIYTGRVGRAGRTLTLMSRTESCSARRKTRS